MGDSLVSALAKSLSLVSSGASTTLTTTTKAVTATSTTTSATPTTTATCSWVGHCEGMRIFIMANPPRLPYPKYWLRPGSSCSTDNDCADSLVCNSGICGTVCSWAGHCTGMCLSSGNTHVTTYTNSLLCSQVLLVQRTMIVLIT